MKKIVSLILALTMCLGCCFALSSCDDGKYEIGILQLVEHPALDAATEGFKQAIIDELGADAVKFNVQNAQNDTAVCATIAGSFVSSNVDLIMANATPALQAAVAATGTIPILGTSVTEYGVALNIENFSGTVGGNISGTSDLAPLDKQAQMIIDWAPDAEKVGLLYCLAEPNSGYQVAEVKKYLEAKGLDVTYYGFNDSNDLPTVCEKAAAESDIIYVPTDNTVADNTAAIDNICETAGVPVIAGEEGICAGCGIATLSISYYDLGYATGLMAVRILRDGADISTMPIDYAATQTPKYNEQNCNALGITPLEGYTKIESE